MIRTMKTLSAAFIVAIRKKLKLTQNELADKLSIKRYNLAKYEKGITMPPGDVIVKLQKIR